MLRKILCSFLVLGLLIFIGVASFHWARAHGSMENPLSRVYACYLENPETPDTLACRDAIITGGSQAVYDWNEVNIPNAAGNHQALIPDGKLCSAGRAKYAAFDQPRTDWARTILPASGMYTFLFNAYVPHNQGYFELYVTKNGYDFSAPLKWSDVERFATIVEPPIVDGNYVMPVSLPSGKSGHHVIYAIWQRNDSPEAFYSCSDVWFGSAPTPIPTAVPACTSPAWNTSVVYQTGDTVSHNGREWLAKWSNANTEPSTIGTTNPWQIEAYCQPGGSATPTPAVTTTPPTSPPPTSPPAGVCAVNYTVANQWNNGFQATVTVTNNGAAPIAGWQLGWIHALGQQVTSAWNAAVFQSGANVTASNPAAHWNGTIGANGGTVTFGFQGTHTGMVAVPDTFTLNGVACNEPGQTPTPTHTATATLTPSSTPTSSVTPSPTPTCPPPITATPENFIVNTGPSPTSEMTTTITAYLGNGEWVTAVGPAGTVTDTEPPFELVVPLQPNSSNTVQVNGRVRALYDSNGCFRAGGYTLTRTVTVVQQGDPGSTCTVNYAVSNAWGSGFVANVTILNTGATPINGWQLGWNFAGNQTITNLWNGNPTQTGQAVSVTNAAWNGNIPANSSVSFGFQAAYSGSNVIPTNFLLNGQACSH